MGNVMKNKTECYEIQFQSAVERRFIMKLLLLLLFFYAHVVGYKWATPACQVLFGAIRHFIF